MGGSEPEAETSGGTAKMFYAIERSLDSLAGVIPNESDSIDKIKSLLRETLARALSKGTAFVGGDDSSKRSGLRSGPMNEPMI
jgi:hypothetical protein